MLLKDHIGEEKQSFKRFSVTFLWSIKSYSVLKTFFLCKLLLQNYFLFCEKSFFFYPSSEYPFTFRGISWRYSNSSFKYSHQIVKTNKKIFDLVWFDKFWGFKDKIFWCSENCFSLVLKKPILLLSPPGYRPTRIYAFQKRLYTGYKPWTYIHDFMACKSIFSFIYEVIPLFTSILLLFLMPSESCIEYGE